MNLTAIITIPARLGYEVTRRTLDLAAGAGRLVGLFGGSEEPAAATAPEPKPTSRPTRRKDLDDVTLTRKVETEIFRESGVAKGKIDVNSADGVVWLRGEARTPELIKRLEERAAAIPEVDRVENLLHLPRTPAPSRTDTPPAQRKTRTQSERTVAQETKAKAERAKAEREAAARTAAATAEAAADAASTGNDDVTLTREVEIAIFAGGVIEEGSIDVHATGGTVWLRGTARDGDQVRDVLRRCFSVEGVERVENFLLLRETSSPPLI